MGRLLVNVSSYHIHETQQDKLSENCKGDIAVVKLEEKVEFNKFIKPICLPTDEILKANHGIVNGWRYHSNSSILPEISRKDKVPIVENALCFKMDNRLVKAAWPESFCAGKIDAGVCKADRGSGLYVEENKKIYLRGIVSASTIEDCSKSSVALFTDVKMYTEFIEQVS